MDEEETLDKQLVQDLSKVFYAKDFFAQNYQTLYEKMKEVGYNYAYADVKKFYDSQEVVQLYRPFSKTVEDLKKKQVINSIITDEPFKQFYMDTMYFNKFGFAVVNGIDLFSKYAFAKAFYWKRVKDENFKGISSLNAKISLVQFKEESEKIGFKISSVTHDMGSEFMGDFSKYCQENKIENITINTLKKNNLLSPIERFNGTMRLMVEKYASIYGKTNLTDIPDLVQAYNKTIHSTTGYRPYFVLTDKNIEDQLRKEYLERKQKIKQELNPVIVNRLKVGDRVRYLIKLVPIGAKTC